MSPRSCNMNIKSISDYNTEQSCERNYTKNFKKIPEREHWKN